MKWPTESLDSVATLDRRSIHPSDAEPATPYVGLEHLNGDGAINCTQTVDSAGLKSNKFHFSDRHVLYGKLRPYLRKISRPAFSGVCSTDIIPILPKEGVSRDFLFHFLRTPGTVDLATSRSSGANLPGLSPKQLASFRVPLPPLDEQKRIACILDAVDALRVKRRDSLAQLDALPQSVFLDMLGDPVTNPHGWDVRELRKTKSRVQIGPFGSLLHKEDYVVGGVPVVNPMHIVGGLIRPGREQTVSEQKAEDLGNYRLRSGDVVMGRRGEMGRCAVVTDSEAGMLCGTGSLFFRPHPDELSPLFLAQTLSSESMKRALASLSQGVTMPNLNRTMVEGLKVALPPLDLQRRFVAIVESIGRQSASQRAHLVELDNLFASLQSRAFRGDL